MSTNSRRQFLKNISVAGFTVGLFPTAILGAKPEVTDVQGCEVTTKDYYGVGPFYTDNPPVKTTDQLASSNEPGERLIITGRVTNLDCTEMIANAIIDVWHANDSGEYDNVGYNLRGQFKTNSQGFYSFETIRPGKYLNGNQYRPSHIHFKITAPGKETLVTQLYFKGDTDIDKDAAASITSGTFNATHRIIELKKNNDDKWEGNWDIVVDGDGATIDVQDLHLDKGIIYNCNPNPFKTEVAIKYGVFKTTHVGISVFDIKGREVALLESKKLTPEKYTAIWTPEERLVAGTYFVALKMNDIQVQYQKIVKL